MCVVDVRVRPRSSVGILEEALDLTVDLCTALFLHQVGSSSNGYAPRLPQQETKSSTKLLALTDPILGPENLLKTGFAQRASLVLTIPVQYDDWKSSTERTLRVPECCYRAVFFTLDHVSPSYFTAVVSHHFVMTRRCRCLLQSVRV